MITKITKDNKGQYDALFQLASQELGLSQAEYINSLDAYFANFPTLSSKSNNIFKTLPLDEPAFEIDANSRVIAVPEVFRKNGISVQGDQAAEVVYFIVDRFFDTVDLYTTTPIIQWEINVNKSVLTGVSPILYKDVAIHGMQDKMIFAWALNNTITQAAGSIKFAVRFYKTGTDGKLAFSLSTLNASATINPSLNYEFNPVNNTFNVQTITDDTALINERYTWANESITPPSSNMPEFDEKIIAHPADCLEHVEEDSLTYHVINLNESGSYKFVVVASANDAGKISYQWQKKQGNGGWINVGEGTEEYFEVLEDESISGSITYYRKLNDSAFEPYIVPSGVETAGEADYKLYVKKNTYTATTVGDYKVIVSNHRGQIPARATSDLVRIPGPAEFAIGENITEVVLDEENSAELNAVAEVGNEYDTLVYAWSKKNASGDFESLNTNTADYSIAFGELDDEAKGLIDESYRVSVKATRNNAETNAQVIDYRVTDVAHPFASAALSETTKDLRTGRTFDLKVVLASVINGQICDKVKYQWFKIAYGDDEEDINDRSNDTAMSEAAEVAKADVANIKLTISTSGTYYCKLINCVNGTESEPVYSEECRVSNV